MPGEWHRVRAREVMDGSPPSMAIATQQPWMNRLHPRQSLTTPMDESPPSMDIVHDTNVGPHIIHGWNSSIHGKRSRHKCWNTLVRGRCAPIHRNRSRHKSWSSHHRWMDLAIPGKRSRLKCWNPLVWAGGKGHTFGPRFLRRTVHSSASRRRRRDHAQLAVTVAVLLFTTPHVPVMRTQ
jgi:hypothetical protein